MQYSKCAAILLLLLQSANSVTDFKVADFGSNFIWGLGTAPTHVEDNLNDAWLDFAVAGHVAAWNNTARPADRLLFWTDYKTEIDLAAATGISTFRLGLDWGRLVPQDPAIAFPSLLPGQGQGQVQDMLALAHYREIFNYILSKNLQIMCTLFHHSLPKWSIAEGGWTNSVTPALFGDYATSIATMLGRNVTRWNTVNEPTVMVLLTYCAGTWPPGLTLSAAKQFDCAFLPDGDFAVGMANIVLGHKNAQAAIKKANPSALVGVAHNVAWHTANTIFDEPVAALIQDKLNYPFIDAVISTCDFVGLNYYGKEVSSGTGIALVDGLEYSESGRCVYPEGLYQLLTGVNDRYKAKYPNMPYIVTENGISDRTDILRPSYLIEHLLAMNQARLEGVNVVGYLHWTTSDNWEWADGYCPRFGMVRVDRYNNLARTPLPSYFLYSSIIHSNSIMSSQRNASWNLIQSAIANGTTHYMCRSIDGQTPFDVPWNRSISNNDWRFVGLTYNQDRTYAIVLSVVFALFVIFCSGGCYYQRVRIRSCCITICCCCNKNVNKESIEVTTKI